MEHFTWEWQIPVLQEDLDSGRPVNASQCAVAKGAQRGFDPDLYDICVTDRVYVIPVSNPEGETAWLHNEASYAYIDNFDNQRPLAPATLSFFLKH